MLGTFIHKKGAGDQFLGQYVYTQDQVDQIRIEDHDQWSRSTNRWIMKYCIAGGLLGIAVSCFAGLMIADPYISAHAAQINNIRSAAEENLRRGVSPVLGQTENFTMPDGDVLTAKVVSIFPDVKPDKHPGLCMILQRPNEERIKICASTTKEPQL